MKTTSLALGLASLLALATAACGGGTLESKDASADDAGDASSKDGAVEAGPLACGKVICQGTDYCIHPCCGGAPPQCLPLPEDGGACPPGFAPANCPNGPGCQQNPCTPPPPYCSPKTDGCMANGREVTCVCA